jgi:hypothetical protein
MRSSTPPLAIGVEHPIVADWLPTRLGCSGGAKSGCLEKETTPEFVRGRAGIILCEGRQLDFLPVPPHRWHVTDPLP